MSSVREHVKIMVALQEKEVAINRIEADLAGIDRRVTKMNDELLNYQEALTRQQEQLVDIQKRYRFNEDEVKLIEEQVVKSKEKLSAVKTNKEYQSMLKEIEELNQKSSDIQDQMLTDLDQIETVEKGLVESEADLVDVQSEVEEKQAKIHQQAEIQRGDLELLHHERDEIWNTVEAKFKLIYENVKRQGQGIVVAAILDGNCQVCRINIPPQLFNDVIRMDTLRMCPNCQRIMYPKVAFENEQ